jgi:monooxygenase
MCSGYYSYRTGHTPVFPGRERFRGTILHPQEWPETLDYTDQRVVVIGSGATAVTLVPAMADRVAHITMLQRSPTYVVSWPDVDRVAQALRTVLPDRWAYRLTRWKNTKFQQTVYRRARADPETVKRKLLGAVRAELGPEYDVATHFTPQYNPWDQRLCLVPNSDLFRAIRAGKASVVTGEIATFTETFGYINASWTLRADLIAEYVCRLLNHMAQTGTNQCTPRLRGADCICRRGRGSSTSARATCSACCTGCRTRAIASRGSTRRTTRATGRCSGSRRWTTG